MRSRHAYGGEADMHEAAPGQPAAGLPDTLAGVQQRLLDIAIYAGALRAQLGEPLSEPERARLHAQLTRAEDLRRNMEQSVAALERLRAPWWRRWRRF